MNEDQLEEAYRQYFRPPRLPARLSDKQEQELSLLAPYGERLDANVYSLGPRDASRKVLFVHGWGGAPAHGATVGAALTQQEMAVYFVEMPGHGALSAKSAVHTVKQAEILSGMVREFGPFQGWIAHSLGCAAAAIALGGLEAQPPRVVLCAPILSLASALERFVRNDPEPDRVGEYIVNRSTQETGIPWDQADPMPSLRSFRGAQQWWYDPEDTLVDSSKFAEIEADSGIARIEVPGAGHLGILVDERFASGVATFIGE